MAAVLGGLGAAVIWSIGTVFASQAARMLGPVLTLAWVMLIGLVVLAAALPLSATPHLSGAALAWLAIGGLGNVAALLLLYHSFGFGQLGVVMPIASTEGGIAAVIAIAAGQPVSAIRGAALAVTVGGVVLTGVSRRPTRPRSQRRATHSVGDLVRHPAGHLPSGHGDRRAAAWAAAAAVLMGLTLFATGRAGSLVPAAWAVLPPRLVGVAAITIPLALRGRLRLPPGSARLLLGAGVCEVAGFLAFAAGARHGIAVAAVVATLTGAFGAGFGRLLFGERLQRTQVLGVITILIGVGTLSALTASTAAASA